MNEWIARLDVGALLDIPGRSIMPTEQCTTRAQVTISMGNSAESRR